MAIDGRLIHLVVGSGELAIEMINGTISGRIFACTCYQSIDSGMSSQLSEWPSSGSPSSVLMSRAKRSLIEIDRNALPALSL